MTNHIFFSYCIPYKNNTLKKHCKWLKKSNTSSFASTSTIFRSLDVFALTFFKWLDKALRFFLTDSCSWRTRPSSLGKRDFRVSQRPWTTLEAFFIASLSVQIHDMSCKVLSCSRRWGWSTAICDDCDSLLYVCFPVHGTGRSKTSEEMS